MKAAIAALALSAAAVAAPIGVAQAHTGITVGIETPAFGVRFGTPYFPVAPVYPAPVYVPAPVYAPVPPVFYAPPRVVVQPAVIYPVVYPFGPPVVVSTLPRDVGCEAPQTWLPQRARRYRDRRIPLRSLLAACPPGSALPRR